MQSTVHMFVLIYFIFTRLTVDQNRLSYFLSIHLFFNRWSTKKGTSAASGVGGGGGEVQAHPSQPLSLRACYVMVGFDFSVSHWLRQWRAIKPKRWKLLSTLNRSNVRNADSRPALVEKAFLLLITIP